MAAQSGVSPIPIDRNLAATEWMDDYGLTWLHVAPKIKLIPDRDKRRPYPLSWDEQARLLRELPGHLAAMALFASAETSRPTAGPRTRSSPLFAHRIIPSSE
jgi:hypothetical protein